MAGRGSEAAMLALPSHDISDDISRNICPSSDCDLGPPTDLSRKKCIIYYYKQGMYSLLKYKLMKQTSLPPTEFLPERSEKAQRLLSDLFVELQEVLFHHDLPERNTSSTGFDKTVHSTLNLCFLPPQDDHWRKKLPLHGKTLIDEKESSPWREPR